MKKNHLHFTLRRLLKHKWYSTINIAGLAAGMAVALLIGLWVWDELSFDHYHQKHADLVQVWSNKASNGTIATTRDIDLPLAPELLSKYPRYFKHAALVSHIEDDHTLGWGDKKIKRPAMWVQPDLPGMLTFKMLAGNRDALKDPSSILIEASMATALFGDTDPIGKPVLLDNKTEMMVAGVFEDFPANTSLSYVSFFLPWDKYVSMNEWIKISASTWGKHAGRLILEMNSNADREQVEAMIRHIPQQHLKVGREELFLHPMDRWHLYNEFNDGKTAGGRIQLVWLFGIIGLFVLLLACINFMNLSTARSEKRAKEVGIRKAIGSLRGQLIRQFLNESLVMAFLALILALILVQLSLPFFNGLAGKHISIAWMDPFFWLLMVGFTLFTGLISGSYPAFYLSGLKPIKVLKGTYRAGRLAAVPRKLLVVVQFTVSIALIIGTIIVFRQIQFARNRPPGYSPAGLLSFNMSNTPGFLLHYNAIRNDLLKTGVIENMSGSSGPQTDIWSSLTGFDWKGKDPGLDPVFGGIAVSHDYGKTVRWKIKEGRDFSRDFITDTNTFLMNEAAIKLTGLQHPVGQTIRWNGRDHIITGVVEDMVMNSPYKKAEPTIFILDYGRINYISIRLKPGAVPPDAMAGIAGVFRTYDPDYLFDYRFIDEEYADKFAPEVRMGRLSVFFATLAIFISCLGIFGLASFVAEQRTKEIGVRKVLGASTFHLWTLLSKEFVMLVGCAALLAIPLAWYFLSQWLQGYEYRSSIPWWIFVVAGLGALIITILTVSYQSIRAALLNPVKSLRTE